MNEIAANKLTSAIKTRCITHTGTFDDDQITDEDGNITLIATLPEELAEKQQDFISQHCPEDILDSVLLNWSKYTSDFKYLSDMGMYSLYIDLQQLASTIELISQKEH